MTALCTVLTVCVITASLMLSEGVSSILSQPFPFFKAAITKLDWDGLSRVSQSDISSSEKFVWMIRKSKQTIFYLFIC